MHHHRRWTPPARTAACVTPRRTRSRHRRMHPNDRGPPPRLRRRLTAPTQRGQKRRSFFCRLSSNFVSSPPCSSGKTAIVSVTDRTGSVGNSRVSRCGSWSRTDRGGQEVKTARTRNMARGRAPDLTRPPHHVPGRRRRRLGNIAVFVAVDAVAARDRRDSPTSHDLQTRAGHHVHRDGVAFLLALIALVGPEFSEIFRQMQQLQP